MLPCCTRPPRARDNVGSLLLLFVLLAPWVAEGEPADALGQLKAAAKEGDTKAQLQLATEYLYGSRRTAAKPAEGTYWLKQASESGNADAMVLLAKLLRQGHTAIDQDLRRSFELVQEAANKEHTEAMDLLAEAYFNDLGVGDLPKKKREKLAVKWLKKAAANGAFRAQVQLGDSYRAGKWVERDGELAVKWYLKAAATADLLNQTSSRKVSPQAVELIQKVHTTLGLMYYKGHGTKKNTTLALEHLSKAAELGHDKVGKVMEEMRKQQELELRKEELMNDPEVEAFLNDPQFSSQQLKASVDGAGSSEFFDKLLKQFDAEL